MLVQYFLDGGPFMWPILIAFIFGLGFAGERFYSLIMSSINTKKFFNDINDALEGEGVDAAVELCEKTHGPVAEIFHAGLTRLHRGLEEVEKAIQNAGALEMSFLEKNMIWLNAVITIAPMLGFTGTVVGMIRAFDAIKKADEISPSIVAGGISEALLTTAFGLIVAMIIQIFQNLFVNRIDKLILDMEENSVQLLDQLHEMEAKKKKKKK
jgi:biopolymer transport protein ExbB